MIKTHARRLLHFTTFRRTFQVGGHTHCSAPSTLAVPSVLMPSCLADRRLSLPYLLAPSPFYLAVQNRNRFILLVEMYSLSPTKAAKP